MHELLLVIILGIVEGITEFLPVSSTGHMVLCEKWMGIDLHDQFWKLFTIFIQIGAIFAVIVYFRDRIIELLKTLRPTPTIAPLAAASAAQGGKPVKLDYAPAAASRISPVWLIAIATVPALIVGKLASKWVDEHLETPTVIALALGIGGLVIAAIEFIRPTPKTERMENMTITQSLIIGICQVLAIVFPGTSRSAATIMPGLMIGISRQAATEFSFFLAIPAMFAACGYKLLKEGSKLNTQQAFLLTIGTLVSFLVAWIVIAAFMRFIRSRTFMPFAIYRVILSIVVLRALR